MKADIHPKATETTVRCACGMEMTVLSTRPEISITICSKCHPYFTGKQKFVDTAGRIEKFQKRFGVEETKEAAKKKVKSKKAMKREQAQAAFKARKEAEKEAAKKMQAEAAKKGKDTKKTSEEKGEAAGDTGGEKTGGDAPKA